MNAAVRMAIGMRALRAPARAAIRRTQYRVGDLGAGDDVLAPTVALTPSGAATCRATLLAAWPVATGGEVPNLAELQIAQSVANFESGCGNSHFNNQGVSVPGHNNFGAVMCKTTPPCDGVTCFEATDHGSNFITPDNPSGAFQACFKAFDTPAEGAAYFIKQITLVRPNSWAAMKAGDIDSFSAHMFAEKYYGGLPVNAPPSVRIANHAATVAKGVNAIAVALGEPIAATRGGAPSSGLDAGDVALAIVFGGVTLYGVRALVRRYA